MPIKTQTYQLINQLADKLLQRFYANEISFAAALNTANQQLKVTLKVDEKLAGKFYNLIGILYTEHDKYTDATQNFTLAQNIFASVEHYEGVANALINVGEVHREQTQYTQSVHWLLKGKRYRQHSQFYRISIFMLFV